MSLVGPRPERPEFMPALERAIPHYRDRLAVRPGVTGLAQVQLPPDTDLASVRRKLAYDLYYIRYRGLWLDLRLVACTAVHMLGVPYEVVALAVRDAAAGSGGSRLRGARPAAAAVRGVTGLRRFFNLQLCGKKERPARRGCDHERGDRGRRRVLSAVERQAAADAEPDAPPRAPPPHHLHRPLPRRPATRRSGPRTSSAITASRRSLVDHPAPAQEGRRLLRPPGRQPALAAALLGRRRSTARCCGRRSQEHESGAASICGNSSGRRS